MSYVLQFDSVYAKELIHHKFFSNYSSNDKHPHFSYKDSSVYVFDEATSALDAISENIVMNNIKSMSKNYIVFVVTHRLKNIKTADMIYVLDNGRITENGKHEELINNKMLYYSLYKQQSWKEYKNAVYKIF